MARWLAAVLVAIVCVSVHAYEEVVPTEVSLLHEATGGEESVMVSADRALRENGDALIQTGQSVASPQVLDLTKKIKNLQSDIKSIKAKKAKAVRQQNSEHGKATKTKPGKKNDRHHKKSISAGAASKDYEADLRRKHSELADLTIKQHDAAKKAAEAAGPKPAPAPKAPAPAPKRAPAPAPAPEPEPAAVDEDGLFSGWEPKYEEMKSSLAKMVQELNAHTAKVKGQMTTNHNEVTSHMKRVKVAYYAKVRAEKAAKSAEKKSKETKVKAVEAEKKKTDIEEKKKKSYEKQVKKLQGKKIPDCGPIKEKEMKAKAEIKRLQRLNAQIKADAEKHSKEMKQKLNAAKAKITKLEQEISKLKSKITKLKSELAAQKAETAKQVGLKKAEEKAKKTSQEKHKKAEEKVKVLERKLKAVTAKYDGVKSKMKNIAGISNGPHEA
jgi:DNA repair exonuclease SbcCD ATPase subunit